MDSLQACEKFLVKKLEDYYGQHYTPAKKQVIIKRFSTLRDDQLVTLHDRIIETAKRLPELPDLLDVYDRMKANAWSNSSPSVPVGSLSGKMPWEARHENATKAANDYARWAMENEPVWVMAQQEGWGSFASKFIKEWAYVQSIVMQGAHGFGMVRDMLGRPNDSEIYSIRLKEMQEAITSACKSGNIMVPAPEWIIQLGREIALQQSIAAQEPQRSAKNLIEATAEQLIDGPQQQVAV